MSVGSNHSERSIFLLIGFIVIFNSSRKAFWYFIFPMTVAYSIYAPVGLIFGPPSYQYIASIFATDVTETGEFISQIPIKNYFYSIIIIIGILFFRWITVKYDLKFHKNKMFLCLIIFIFSLHQSPSEYFKNVVSSSILVKNELVKLNNLTINSNWGESNLNNNSRYKNYVLVIGESARKDYHHAYGYPINNTPFMSESSGLLVDGLTSGGTNTIASLRLMLTMPDKSRWEPDYSLNFVDLANSAHLKTYWVSNQGYMSEFDTPISAIAKHSQHMDFIKSGTLTSENTSDFLLVNRVKDILLKNKKTDKSLIIVHIVGSHPDACERVNDYKLLLDNKDKKYSYINCYISSINKTDDLLKEINALLIDDYKNNNNSFSLLYFSDHGLAHRDIDGVINFNNNRASKLHFDIPLFMTASDIHERKVCSSFKSGLNFTNGIANWLGITNDKLDPNYSLFDCKDDPEDYGLSKIISEILGEPDPAIDIRGK